MIKPIKKIMRHYIYDMKILNKLIVSHFLLLLIPVVIISFLFYNQLFDIVEENIMSSEQHTTQQTTSYIEYIIGQLYSSSNTILDDKNLNTIFNIQDGFVENYLSGNPEAERNITSFLQSAQHQVDGTVITGVSVYVDEGYAFLCEHPRYKSYGIFKPTDSIVSSTWYEMMQKPTEDDTGQAVWNDYLVCPKDYLTTEEKTLSGTFAVIRPIFNSENVSPVAYLALYFSKHNIEQSLKKALSTPDSVTYLINRDNYLVAASDYGLANNHFIKSSALMSLFPEQNSWEKVFFGSTATNASYSEISGSDWYLLSVMPADSVSSRKNSMFIKFILVYLIVAGITYFGAIMLATSLTKRIQMLKRQLVTVESGHPMPLKLDPGCDEVGSLIETYNSMTLQMKELTEEKIQIVSDMKTAELKALQAQINPHFLYNTLDMINWLSKKGLEEDVSTAIYNLSKFYKMTLSSGNVVVTIEDELQHVELYVNLQNMRYNNKINLIIDVPEDVLSHTVPKIILQPIVENAIQHGIMCKPSKEGYIVITAWLEDDIIVLSVSDDGVGIAQEKLDQIMAGNFSSKSGSSIGILNTHERLKLFFEDEQFGLTCSSTPGQGTDITIKMPLD